MHAALQFDVFVAPHSFAHKGRSQVGWANMVNGKLKTQTHITACFRVHLNYCRNEAIVFCFHWMFLPTVHLRKCNCTNPFQRKLHGKACLFSIQLINAGFAADCNDAQRAMKMFNKTENRVRWHLFASNSIFCDLLRYVVEERLIYLKLKCTFAFMRVKWNGIDVFVTKWIWMQSNYFIQNI